jgi:transcriptional regulator GlxA family with amidase domain
MRGVRDPVISFVVYPGFTALDAVGPYEVLSRLPGFKAMFVAQTLEPVRSDRGLVLKPDGTFAGVPQPAVLFVPGGPGQIEQMENRTLIGYLKRAAESAQLVASVCTGSLLLAQAGLLEGRRATTHWLAMDALGALGATPVAKRVVRDGSVVTGAGVSAGIDLALAIAAGLTSDEVAMTIQLGIEYDPKPPFDAGSPEKAPPEIVEALRERTRSFLSKPSSTP